MKVDEAIFYLKTDREQKIDAMSSAEVAKKTCTVIAYDMGIEALEKQIPKKYVDGRYPWAICPTCGGSINTEIVQEHIQNCETSYCEHCGQAIDWSDTE